MSTRATRQKAPNVGEAGKPAARILSLDSQTKWGRIAAIAWISGERYYFMIDKNGSVAMMPALVVETR